MEREIVKSKLIRILENEVVSKKNIEEETIFFNEIEMDSLVVVSLVVRIEEEFGITIDDVSEFLDGLDYVSGLIDYIEKKVNQNI